MPVKVTDKTRTETTHNKAQHIKVDAGGHLLVMSSKDNGASTLAVYAPGVWAFATAEANARASS
jgi:hypothetical protein